MALDPLATTDDLEARLGRTLTENETGQAATLLADASAAVRTYTGQEFTAATSTVRLRAKGGAVRLPQRPVGDVTAVNDTDGDPVGFTWFYGDQVVLTNPWTPSWVDVTYRHGSEEIPDNVIGIVCQMAGRAMGAPADQSGLAAETIGDYSYRIGTAAASGAVGMLPDERAVLDRYRRVGGTAWVAS